MKKWLDEFKQFLIALPRGAKRAIMLGLDTLAIPVALWFALIIRTGGEVSPYIHNALISLPFLMLLTVPVFIRLGLYRSILRFAGPEIILSILKGVTLSALVLAAIIALGRLHEFPRSVMLIYWLLMVFYMVGVRYLIRVFFSQETSTIGGRKTAIYGAGMAGHKLAKMLESNDEIQPVCFFDDNPAIAGSIVGGLPVYHTAEIGDIVNRLSIEQILLALPNVSRRRRKEIIDSLEQFPVHVFTIPAIEDIVSGKARVDEIREIDISDLLGRDPVKPVADLFQACINGKVVMVTGAGGSIGSELCRQIVNLEPRALILFELSEYGLYQINSELENYLNKAGRSGAFPIKAMLGNVQDRDRLRAVMSGFGVQTIYHTAAYKHVPIVEYNIVDGVLNNIFGTLAVAETAIETGVETFVSVSTDKAVRPTNVMGATKRFAELILQGLSERSTETRFCMVRFGNVLDSSGSVVPVFRRQIRQGGPVTVTHRDIQRYFMTIQEAAQLVIQAGAMGEGGDVFVLDMGEPVRIDDLARKMIHLMGMSVKSEKNPDGDIAIEYTGLRPGEKLYEELLIGDNVEATRHPMIMRAMEATLPWSKLETCLDVLLTACKEMNYEKIRSILLAVVNDYVPSSDIVDHLGAMELASAENTRSLH